jgi:FkbM family methyltransferase
MKLGAKGLGLLNYESRLVGGEQHFIRRYLGNLESPVVFDVGANRGDWSAHVMQVNPSARICAFEPHPETFRRLRQNLPAIDAHNVALGARHGSLRLFDYADRSGSSHATLVDGAIEDVHRQRTNSFDVAVTTIDDFCREQSISGIDLLKIDTEGYELHVLKGAEGALKARRIKAVQFEISQIHALTHTFVQDILDVIGPAFRVFRILPRGLLELCSQSRWQREQFAYQNLVALLRESHDAPPTAT